MNLQEQFNLNQAKDFNIPPGEYEGPLVVNKPCVIHGNMSTLWSKTEPALLIDSGDVSLKDLRVEVVGMEDTERVTAVKTNYADIGLTNVEVNGNIVGLSQEAGNWTLPSLISLGEFAAGNENSFQIEIQAPTEAVLKNNIDDIEIHPQKLVEGKNLITIKTRSMRANTILYGEIFVMTKVSRRLCLMGKALADAPTHQEKRPYLDSEIISQPVAVNPTQNLKLPDETGIGITIDSYASDTEDIQEIKKGQRLAIQDLKLDGLKIKYSHRGTKKPLEVDSYAFLLTEQEKVVDDGGLVFFGNGKSQCGSVTMDKKNNGESMLLNLEKVPSGIQKVVVCYAVYGENVNENFSIVEEPMIRIYSGDKPVYRFRLSDLESEKTIVAIEIYRYKDQWKANFVGSGYKSGLRQLCESYGVAVD